MHRNMFVLTSILPEEVLALIFQFNAFSVQPYPPTLNLGWICATHVCRRWCQVALDDLTLWTHFSTKLPNKEWIAERLSCTRHTLLAISLNGVR